ncbi:MAG: hypothetical protein ACRDPT_09335 [Streptomycetales bacterium]
MTFNGDVATQAEHPSLGAAFGDVQVTLARDGYATEWRVDDKGAVHFRVVATDSACPECLVPKPVMAAILADALKGTGHELGELELPSDRAG